MAGGLLPRFEYDPGTGTVQIDLTVPLTNPDTNDLNWSGAEAKSGTGKRQRNTFYIEEIKTLKFEFVTRANRDKIETMMKDWVIKGNTFTYYPDVTDLLTFFTLEYMPKTWVGSKRTALALDRWDIELVVREYIA